MKLGKLITQNKVCLLVYGIVALLVIWPLLGSGYILTLDMVFTPSIDMPKSVTSSFLFRAALHALNIIIPSDVLQKLILFAILFLSGIGMYRLSRLLLRRSNVPANGLQFGAYVSGFLYTINPFTYSRFMAGQYSVLLGYALIPFFVVSLLYFLKTPSLKRAFYLSLVTILISIVSIHTLGLLLILVIIALIQAQWGLRQSAQEIKRLLAYGAVAVGIFVLASSYWLLPLTQGTGTTATAIETFQNTDQPEFATEGSGVLGKLIHTMRLQGFWGERNNLFVLPQDQLPIWGIIVVLLWLLVGIGIVLSWRSHRTTTILFYSSAFIAALLAAGVGTGWLVDHFPFFAGYREPQKFVGLVALAHSVFIGFAISGLMTRMRSKIATGVISVVVGLLIIGLTPGMLNGFAGQLAPRQYPAGWYVANDRLNKDTTDFRVLFLPWHLYMYYDFAGRLIANPGEDFFDKPTIVSDDPELGNVPPAIPDSTKRLLGTTILPKASQGRTLGQALATLNIKYILLARENDYQDYDYLNRQEDLRVVLRNETIVLYLNTAFTKENK